MNFENIICQVLTESGSPMEISQVLSSIDDDDLDVSLIEIKKCISASQKLNFTNSGKCVLSEWLNKPGSNYDVDENRVIVGNYFKRKAQEKDTTRRTFASHIKELEIFINDNRHFPFSSSDSDDERNLHLWWTNTNKRAHLPPAQKKEVERIQKQYSKFKVDKRRYEWDFKIEEYWRYAEANNAFPPYNSHLYVWYLNNRADYRNHRMDEEQTTKFKELYDYVEEVRRLIAESRHHASTVIGSQSKKNIDHVYVNLF